MAQETTDKKVREGVPCSEEALQEHLKAFSDIEASIAFVDKKGKEL